MKALVTGANGMLGHEVVRTLEMMGHEVWATDISSGQDSLDITSPDQIRYALRSFCPGWVINCAAYTNVDQAEGHEEEALRLNAKGPEILAFACRKYSVKLVHVSTDYVFDGTKGSPYTEEDTTNPVNAYGASKLAGEIAIRHQMKDYLIIRTQWLIGAHGKNFVSTILSAARLRDSISVVNDQWGSPTFASDLARAVAMLMDVDARGIFHVCNRGKATWYDLARKAVGLAGLETRVIPVSTEEYPLPARRPAYSILATRKFTSVTGRLMPLWQVSLKGYMSENHL